ncbi:hypothetical protein SK069_12945 [Patulibacter brassicae]|jgi:hypothetical protein|uniref:Uncharacterized protein n=1 Tax=Patulibacter brassicae TaxID=1705717 RepID=A0ABU4VNJ3_9ACTN|nr:hypothetical protein [Patulibacter brassicae]MDX8152506.1 hypothetical protein [Patulibacter brassicae]
MVPPLLATAAVAILLILAGTRGQRPGRVLLGGALLTAAALATLVLVLPLALGIAAGWVVASIGVGLSAAGASIARRAPTPAPRRSRPSSAATA